MAAAKLHTIQACRVQRCIAVLKKLSLLWVHCRRLGR
jgi:hypothetical protein